MDEQDKFLKQMENLQVPVIEPPTHQKKVKMAIMNAERSATLGVWLIIVPCYFLLCVCMYYCFHVHMSWLQAMFNMMLNTQNNVWLRILSPILFIALPTVSVIINALAVIHVGARPIDANKSKVKEYSITIKIKIWNIVLLLLSLAIAFTFIAYIITLNITVKI